MIPSRALKLLNFQVIFMTVFLLCIGLIFIYSAMHNESGQSPFLMRQLVWVLMGLVVFWMCLNVDFRFMGSLSYLFYAVGIVGLLIVRVAGEVRKGAESWLGFGFFNVQPSEIAKLGFIFAMARFMSENIDERKKMKFIFMTLILAAIPMGLIVIQPDLGSAMVLIPVYLGMLIIGGSSKKYIFLLLILGISMVPIGWSFLHEYQRLRLTVFMNPNLDPLGAGYNAIQSKIAMGSGGFLGKGWLQGTQSQLHFLPERHTDFIFSVIGEEWGFAGCLIVLAAYFFLVMGGFRIAQSSKDLFGRFLASGFTLLLSAHVIINTGMTVGVMPITGIPLPLLSYGGSHLVTMMIAIGLLENIHLRKSMF